MASAPAPIPTQVVEDVERVVEDVRSVEAEVQAATAPSQTSNSAVRAAELELRHLVDRETAATVTATHSLHCSILQEHSTLVHIVEENGAKRIEQFVNRR